jgi:hypothetical protein
MLYESPTQVTYQWGLNRSRIFEWLAISDSSSSSFTRRCVKFHEISMNFGDHVTVLFNNYSKEFERLGCPRHCAAAKFENRFSEVEQIDRAQRGCSKLIALIPVVCSIYNFCKSPRYARQVRTPQAAMHTINPFLSSPSQSHNQPRSCTVYLCLLLSRPKPNQGMSNNGLSFLISSHSSFETSDR